MITGNKIYLSIETNGLDLDKFEIIEVDLAIADFDQEFRFVHVAAVGPRHLPTRIKARLQPLGIGVFDLIPKGHEQLLGLRAGFFAGGRAVAGQGACAAGDQSDEHCDAKNPRPAEADEKCFPLPRRSCLLDLFGFAFGI